LNRLHLPYNIQVKGYLSLNFSLGAGSASLTRTLITTRTTEIRLSVGNNGCRNLDTREVLKVKRLQEFLYSKRTHKRFHRKKNSEKKDNF
jgi:hypothetical protein